MSQNLTQPEEIDEILRAMTFAELPFTAPIAEECYPGNASIAPLTINALRFPVSLLPGSAAHVNKTL